MNAGRAVLRVSTIYCAQVHSLRLDEEGPAVHPSVQSSLSFQEEPGYFSSKLPGSRSLENLGRPAVARHLERSPLHSLPRSMSSNLDVDGASAWQAMLRGVNLPNGWPARRIG